MGGVPSPLTGLEKGGFWGSLSLRFLPLGRWAQDHLFTVCVNALNLSSLLGHGGRFSLLGCWFWGCLCYLELHPFGDQAVPALGGEFWGAPGVSNPSITLTKLLAPPSFLVLFFVPTAHTGGISFITIFGEERLCRGH